MTDVEDTGGADGGVGGVGPDGGVADGGLVADGAEAAGTERAQVGLLFQIYRTHLVNTRLVSRALEPTGLSGDDYAVYSYLLQGPQTLTQLADGVGMPLTTAAGYVRRFDRDGHIARSPNPADGRSHLLSLTPSGHQLVVETAAIFSKTVAHLDAVMAARGVDSGELVAQLRLVQELVADALDDIDRPSQG